jgi:microcystin-dependent protein
MKRQDTDEGFHLGDEIAVLRSRLQALEAQLARRRMNRWAPRRLALVLSAGVLLALGGVLYGQGGGEALFVAPSGRVGIGRTDPSAALDVNGRIKDQTGFVVAVGSIIAFAGTQAPEGWLFCDGTKIPDDKFSDLRGVLQRDVTPDLRGRTLVGAGQGAGLTKRILGQQGGEENHKMSIAEMPAHKHYGFGEGYQDWPLGVMEKNKMGSNGGKDYDNYYYGTTDAGGSTPFNNMQPYQVVNYIIKY